MFGLVLTIPKCQHDIGSIVKFENIRVHSASVSAAQQIIKMAFPTFKICPRFLSCVIAGFISVEMEKHNNLKASNSVGRSPGSDKTESNIFEHTCQQTFDLPHISFAWMGNAVTR